MAQIGKLSGIGGRLSCRILEVSPTEPLQEVPHETLFLQFLLRKRRRRWLWGRSLWDGEAAAHFLSAAVFSLLGEFLFQDGRPDQEICLLHRYPEPLDSGTFFNSTTLEPVV
jgi:hypothetical protein